MSIFNGIYSNSRNRTWAKSESGATMVEFAVLVGVVLFLVLAIVDFSRYMTTKSLLRKATQTAARAASSISDFDADISGIPTTAAERIAFNASWRDVEEIAYDITNPFVDRSAAGPGGDSDRSIQLRPYTAPDGRVSDVAIIRPGESLDRLTDDGNGGSGVSEHDTLCPPGGCTNTCTLPDGTTPCPVYLPGDDYEELLRNHPIVVEMRAKVDTWLPFGGPDGFEVVVRSYVFRELPADPSRQNPAEPPPPSCDDNCVPPEFLVGGGNCVCDTTTTTTTTQPPVNNVNNNNNNNNNQNQNNNNNNNNNVNNNTSNTTTTTRRCTATPRPGCSINPRTGSCSGGNG